VEFAVETLEVKHIIVCGHYGCGGVRSALDGHRHGIVDHWLQPIRDVAEANEQELTVIEGKEPRLDRISELSVVAQVSSLARTPIIQSAWARGKDVSIHGWIYGLSDGLIRDLESGATGQETSGGAGGYAHA
jgi:carbonic anhydrase